MFTIIIPSRNVENLRACAAAILRHEPHMYTGNIIVVDDDESDKIKRFCSGGNHTRIKGIKPFIFARAANMGLRHAFEAGCDSAVLLNDDALLQTPNGFAQLSYVAATDVSLGLLSPATNNVGNENQNYRGYKRIRYEERMICFVCVLIPRETWDLVGELDERFTGYGTEDDDYSLRVRQAGLRLGIWDPCQVDHGSLVSTFRGPANAGGDFSANLELFKQKWGHDNLGRTA